MKVICTNAELSKQLIRLIKKYPKVAIATAWASADTKVFRALLERRDQIVGAAIGTHFYQTHPDVLDVFVGSAKVKFVLQPNGIFHPKVYLFWNSQAWEVVVGSPNLTVGALTKNSELSVLITSSDGQPDLGREFFDVIQDYLAEGVTITQQQADRYRGLWKLKVRQLEKVVDLYGSRPASKPAVLSNVMSMDWAGYLAMAKEMNKTHGFKARLAMLKAVRERFVEHVISHRNQASRFPP